MKNLIPVRSSRRSAVRTCTASAALLLLAGLATGVQGATISKADNQDDLNLGSSWVGGTPPTSADIAQWHIFVTGANTTSLGADTNWAGIQILGAGGPVTINAGNTLTLGSSFIDMTTAAADLTLNCGLTLGAAQLWTNQLGRTLTVNGNIGGLFALTKKGEGVLVLNGTNAQTSTTVGDGTSKCGSVSVGNSSGLGNGLATLTGTGLGAVWLSGGVTVANVLSVNGAAGNGITAYGNIRNLSGYNRWTGLLTNNASPRVGCDMGVLEFGPAGFMLGNNSGARGPNFVGAGDFIVSGPILKFTAGSAANTCQKALGTGTLRLSGANTYTGQTTLTSGTTMLDYGSVANLIPNTSVLSLQGGRVTLSGGSATDAVASTSVAGGGSGVTRSSGTSVLRLNAINRTAGATVDFGMMGVADTDAANVNGILGGYATVAGADWAINTTGGADGPISAYSSYQTATDPSVWAAADNVTLSGNPSANVPTKAVNSLRLTAASTVTIDSGATLTNSSGGILVTDSGATTIAGADAAAAIVPGGTNTDLIVHQYSSADCTISAVIGNGGDTNRLTKSGPGKLILSGANTYRSQTHLNGGTLSISANNNLGNPAYGTQINFNGATLQVTADVTFDNAGANKRNFNFNDFTSGTIEVTGANTANITGLLGGRGWLTKTGSGTLVLSGASTTYQGDFLLNGGTLRTGVAETPGVSGPFGNQAIGPVSGVSCFIHFGGGTLQYSNGVNGADYSFRFSQDPNQAYSVDTAGTNVLWASALKSAGGSLTKSGAGILALTAASTYNGQTAINAGTIALGAAGSFNNSSQLSLAAGATLDIWALGSTTYNLSNALSASGTGVVMGSTAAAITNAFGGAVNLGTQPITLAYDGSNPALIVTPGPLQAQGNAWTINGSALSPSSTYMIAGSSSASLSGTHTVYGTAISGMTGSISGVGATVQLTTSAALTASTTTVAASANPSIYGTGPTFLATVAAAGPSGTVLFVLDGVPQLPAAAVFGGLATFTAPNSLSAGTHTVVAQYSGDATHGSSVSTTLNQTVNPKVLTMSGLSVPASRVYDGTALAYVSGVPLLQAAEPFGTGTSSDGLPYTGDAVSVNGLATGTYNSEDVATASTVTFSGLYLLGAQAANYSLTIQSPASATITAKPLTVASPAVTPKPYDGTTTATVTGSLQPVEAPGTGTAADGKPFFGDNVTLALSGTFSDKNVGTGKTVTSGSSIGGADSGDYSLTQPALTGNITQTNLTVTATTDTKIYDGTTNASAIPTVGPGSIQTGDTANFTEAYANKNAGTGKTLIPAGSVTDGNGGANYNVTFVNDTTGVINQTNITVTATTNTKVYDGTTSAAALPTVTSGSIQTGDTANFTETYDNKNVGTGKTLTPAGAVTDGNGGANYNVTFLNDTTGVITALTTSCLLVSAPNPSGPGTNVSFTATLDGAPPAADKPTGDVVFTAGGVPFSTNTLVSGVAAASNAALPLGTNAIQAEYAGDGNFLGSTCSVAQVVQLFVTCSQTNALLSISNNLDGTFTLTFLGTPQADYYVIGSADVTAAVNTWTPLAGSTNTVTNISGLWQFIVTNTAPQRFYRSTAVSNCP